MIKLIIATGINGEIGKGNKLLTHIPEDLAYFKEQTEGCTVVMGNNSYKSLPFKHGLPNRNNIVLTSEQECAITYLNSSIRKVNNLDSLIDEMLTYDDEYYWVIGGSMIYGQFKDIVEEVHHTQINKSFPDADTYFDMSWVKNALQWEKVSSKRLTQGVVAVVYKRVW